MSRDMTKPTKWTSEDADSLGICPVWSDAQSDQSIRCAQCVAMDASFLHADSEDSDQTGRMPRLIWVFAGYTLTLLVLSWGGSNYDLFCNLRWFVLLHFNDKYINCNFPKFRDTMCASTEDPNQTVSMEMSNKYIFSHFPLFTYLYFELKQKFKCIYTEHAELQKAKVWSKLLYESR